MARLPLLGARGRVDALTLRRLLSLHRCPPLSSAVADRNYNRWG
jgi:hypothetical protein